MLKANSLVLVNTLARMSLKAESSRYHLGYLWWIIEPLLFVGVFYVVFGLFLQLGKANFLLFLICGKLPFIWFSKTVASSAQSIIANAGLIGSAHLPKALFPLARVFESAYKQCIVFVVLLLLAMMLGPAPGAAWLWLVPLVLTQFLMNTACALIGAYVVCFVRDAEHFIGMGILFLMFSSGVFWDVRDIADPRTADFLMAINPLAFVLDGYRQVLMHGNGVDGLHLLGVLLFFGLICAGMLALMRKHSRLLALRALGA